MNKSADKSRKNMEFTVAEEGTLLPLLFAAMPDKSRTTVKSYLSHGQVSVNGCRTTRFDHALSSGDRISVVSGKTGAIFRHPMMRIVYEDDHIIVIDKRSGLLSVATDKEQKKSAFYILSNYVKRNDPSSRIFIVHRLDRETSGLMVFARNQQVQEILQRSWKVLVKDRRYVAVTEGTPVNDEGEIVSYLTEDRNLKVWASHRGEGHEAITYYSVLHRGRQYSMLELRLETGKKNQIRAHLEWKKIPIAGDKKYGATTNPVGRVCLHACKLYFIHPVTGEELDFTTPIPALFEGLVK